MSKRNLARGIDDVVSFALAIRPTQITINSGNDGSDRIIEVSSDLYLYDKLSQKDVATIDELVEKFERVRPIFEATAEINRIAESYAETDPGVKHGDADIDLENSKIITISKGQFALAKKYGLLAKQISDLHRSASVEQASTEYQAMCAELQREREALLKDFEVRPDLENAIGSYAVGAGGDPTTTRGTWAAIVYVGVEIYVIV